MIVAPYATLLQALAAMEEGGARIALVAEPDGRLVGVVTNADVRRHLLTGGGVDNVVTQAMNTGPVTARPATPLERVRTLMHVTGFSQLPVVSEPGILLGLYFREPDERR